MPVDVALNKAIRDRVRRDLALPFADPILAIDEFVEDTSEESIAKFRAAGAIPTRRADADAARRAADAARRAAIAPGAGHLIAHTSFNAVAGTNWFFSVAGPISFPYVLEAAYISMLSTLAAGVSDARSFAILISSNNSIDLASLQSDQSTILQADGEIDGIDRFGVQMGGANNVNANLPIGQSVFAVPTFLKVGLNNLGVGFVVPSVTMTIREEALPVFPGFQFLPPVGRTVININTQSTRTRGTRRRAPRAAVISVSQGGRIINQRTVAWESLGSPIRRDWFNRQVGGVGDPNIRWIP